MTPKVSIIVPVYNVEQYLPQCLDSLVNQTFKDIEIICFNDASPDGSLQILRDYQRKDPRIQIIDSQINIKQGGGRNAGIRASRAPYVMFVDSDDWVAPEFVENLYRTITEKDADIATCDYYQQDETNGRKQLFISLGVKTSEYTELLKHKLAENGAPIWAAIYRKEHFITYDLWFPENLFYEDNAISAALYCSANKIVKINEPLYYSRIRPNSTTFLKNDPRTASKLPKYTSTTSNVSDSLKNIAKI